jgi:predicted membrane-bound spermidine synthase
MSAVYFACLGAGFMAFELPVIQISTLFLGHPTYALSVVLLGLLAAAGAGSALMGRFHWKAGRAALVVVPVLAHASGVGLLPAVHALMQLPDWARFAVALLYLVLIGIPLGMPFVAGTRLLDNDRPGQVAWAWASTAPAPCSAPACAW